MTSHREVLGLIPARGGSKGIPGKNLAPLAGRPLLEHTCRAAQASARLTRAVVSTDSAEIADAARACGMEVLMRPDALAGDDTPMGAVVRHTVDALRQSGYAPDVVVVLQPTSPLRRAEHIDAAVDLLLESGADGVVSVVEVPHNFTPGSLMVMDAGRVSRWRADEPAAVLRQQKPALYARNGPAVLAVTTASAMTRGLYDGDLRGLVMDRASSLDIDSAVDLKLAEFWLASLNG